MRFHFQCIFGANCRSVQLSSVVAIEILRVVSARIATFTLTLTHTRTDSFWLPHVGAISYCQLIHHIRLDLIDIYAWLEAMLRFIIGLLIWTALTVIVICDVDYYKVLSVDRQASDKDIKRQYRKLSKQWHPDKNRGDETAHERFVQVSEGTSCTSAITLTYFSLRGIV